MLEQRASTPRCGGHRYLVLLRTCSTTIRLPGDRGQGLLACLGDLIDRRFGGTVTKRYSFELVLGRSTGN